MTRADARGRLEGDAREVRGKRLGYAHMIESLHNGILHNNTRPLHKTHLCPAGPPPLHTRTYVSMTRDNAAQSRNNATQQCHTNPQYHMTTPSSTNAATQTCGQRTVPLANVSAFFMHMRPKGCQQHACQEQRDRKIGSCNNTWQNMFMLERSKS